MSIPLRDALLVPWSTNFNARLVASPITFACSQQQAEAYTAVHLPYLAAQQVLVDARAAGTRSESQTAARDTAKAALLRYARELYAHIRASSAVANANKVLIGVHVRAPGGNTPVPAPTARPGLGLVSVAARTVTVHIHDSASSTKRGKGAGALSAWVYTFVGAEYASDPMLWQFQGAFNKSPATIVFPDTVASGAQVWIRAAWVNRRGQTGPLSVPITTHVQGGGASASAAAANVKIAA